MNENKNCQSIIFRAEKTPTLPYLDLKTKYRLNTCVVGRSDCELGMKPINRTSTQARG
jgi:hypothetical protein